jgi:hypothetical protein
MEIIETTGDTALLRVTKDELITLANAINEAQEAIEDWEFSTRMGVDAAEAEELRKKLSTLLDSMRPDRT